MCHNQITKEKLLRILRKRFIVYSGAKVMIQTSHEKWQAKKYWNNTNMLKRNKNTNPEFLSSKNVLHKLKQSNFFSRKAKAE